MNTRWLTGIRYQSGPTAESPCWEMRPVEERALNGYENLEDVISTRELEDIANNYKKVAGFDKEILNSRASLVDA